MTQPFDPLNPPTAALGLRAGMFDGAMHCPNPTCGFATSDPNVFECPSCNTVWRHRPKPIETVPSGPAVGTQMAMTCSVCGIAFSVVNPPIFDGAGLSHASCLTVKSEPAAPENVPSGYLTVVSETRPKKKRRKRKRTRPANVTSHHESNDTSLDASPGPDSRNAGGGERPAGKQLPHKSPAATTRHSALAEDASGQVGAPDQSSERSAG